MKTLSEFLGLAGFIVILILFSVGSVSAASFYDDNPGDDLYWTHRIPIIVSESEGVGRVSEPVAINVSQLFGDMNLSLVDASSLRLVDPEKRRLGEDNGHAIAYQVGDDGDNNLSEGDEIVFLAEAKDQSDKTYYLYFSLKDSGITEASYESDLSLDYDGGKALLVENDVLYLEGFTTGYFTVHRMDSKQTGESLAYSPLGLDHGYSIETSNYNESFVRYDKDWSCSLTSKGPIRIKVLCTASSENFDVSKQFTFYSKNSFYDTENKITKKNSLLSNVKWVIYDVLNPQYSNDSSSYQLYHEGSGDAKISYLRALNTQNGGGGDKVFGLMAKGDASLSFEDREGEYDLFGETIHLAASTSKKVLVRHILVDYGSEDEARQYPMFKAPLSVVSEPVEENRLVVLEPNPETVFDVAFENQSIVMIRTSIFRSSGTSLIYCNLTDSYGKVVQSDIKLVDDGTGGDIKAFDGVWANKNLIKLYSGDTTGIWSIRCVEEGSQSVTTTAENTFYVVSKGGYRRIEFFNIYCKAGDHFKHNPAQTRPGDEAELHICLMNTGTHDENNVRVTMPELPSGWKLQDVFVDRLIKGDEIPAVMTLLVPKTQVPTSKILRIEIIANGTVIGHDSLQVDVVSPRIDSSVSLYGANLLVSALDNGIPVPEAKVKLLYETGKVQSARTDSEGIAEIPAIDAGEIFITVSKLGYNNTEMRISVSEPKGESTLHLLPVMVLLVIFAHLAISKRVQIINYLRFKRI